MINGSFPHGGVVITGGGGGIGAAVAAAFGRAGYGVVVNDVGVDVAGDHPSPTAADRVAADLVEAGARAVAHHGSVADFDTAKGLIQLAVDSYGRLDALVTCHGILRERMIFNMTEDEWDSVIAVHLKGTFACFRFATAQMRTQHAGSIVALGSAAGMEGSAAQANYAAAKAGIVALVQSSALAMGKYGVNVNCIIPSASTRMTARLTEASAGTRPVEERRGPELIAAVALALADPSCRGLTGQSVTAAGRRVALWRHPTEEPSIELADDLTDVDVRAALSQVLRPTPLRRFAALGLVEPRTGSVADGSDGRNSGG